MTIRHKSRFINQTLIKEATLPYLLKGGFIRALPSEKDPTTAWGLRAKRKTDWGLVRPEKRSGRKPYPRLELRCINPECRKQAATFKGKTHEQALIRAWEVGWYYRLEDGLELCYCPKCKPGVENGEYKKGSRVHSRVDGETYKVLRWVPKGEHPLNYGYWPELWCLNKSKDERVFIFWKGEPPVGLEMIYENTNFRL